MGVFVASATLIASVANAQQGKTSTKTPGKVSVKPAPAAKPTTVTTITTKTTVKKDSTVVKRVVKHHKPKPKAKVAPREEVMEYNNKSGAAVVEVFDGKTYVNGELVSSNDKNVRRRIVVNVRDEERQKVEPIEEKEYTDNSRRTVLGVLTDQYGDYDGAHISQVVRNSPADEAGLMPGDLIIRINGHDIRDSWDLINVLNDHDGGERITITYDRRGRVLHADAILAETSTMRRHQTYDYTVPDLHGKRRVPGPFLNAYTYNTVDNYFDYTPTMGISAQGASNGRGVAILDVKSASPADYAGLRNGDVIIRMDHLRVTTVADIQDILDDTWPNQKIAVEFKRDGVLMYTYIRFTKEKTRKEL